MSAELDVLQIVSERFAATGLDFMLTGSFALTFYGTPRMTRDLDLVVALRVEDARRLVDVFGRDFYIDEDAIKDAVSTRRLFNMMHYESGMKVDVIVRKNDEYRLTEFARRRPLVFDSIKSWIVSKEDLILSKLLWAQDGTSEMQMRDVRSLITEPLNREYLMLWARRLGVDTPLAEMIR